MSDRSTAIMSKKKKKNKTAKGAFFMCQNTSTPLAALLVCGANDLPLTSAIVPAASRRRPRLLLQENNINSSSKFKQQVHEAGEPLLKLLKKKSNDGDKGDNNNKVTRHDHHPNPQRRHSFQVVVMRVSLHCQGCAGQVKRHLSKMEGVTSFSIDLETQRVTVMGHVSPVVVVQSISKVKRAELWPTSPSPSSD